MNVLHHPSGRIPRALDESHPSIHPPGPPPTPLKKGVTLHTHLSTLGQRQLNRSHKRNMIEILSITAHHRTTVVIARCLLGFPKKSGNSEFTPKHFRCTAVQLRKCGARARERERGKREITCTRFEISFRKWRGMGKCGKIIYFLLICFCGGSEGLQCATGGVNL